MADPQVPIKAIKKASIIIHNILNNVDNFESIGDIVKEYDKALGLIDRIVSNSFKVFDETRMQDIYRTAYNEIGDKLFAGQTQLDFSPLPRGNQSAAFKESRKRYNEAVRAMGQMARFNLQDRKTMHRAVFSSIVEGDARRKRLELDAAKKGIDIDVKDLDKITADIAKSFSPQTGVRKFRNEYFGIGKDDVTNKKLFDLFWGRNWDNISRDMTDIIDKGIKKGTGARSVQKEVMNRLTKAFPTQRQIETVTGKKILSKEPYFPVPVRQKDGTMGVRRLGMSYYAQLKTGDYATRMQSAGTVRGMMDAGFDTVTYELHGSQDHTEICLKLSGNGKGMRYSVSGKSATYPQLKIYPPAHYNCFSTVDPVPSGEQERFKITDNQKDDIEVDTIKEAQADQKEFDKTGGIKKKKKNDQSIVDKNALPEIQAVSDKQRKFAEESRIRKINQLEKEMQIYSEIKPEEVEKRIKKDYFERMERRLGNFESNIENFNQDKNRVISTAYSIASESDKFMKPAIIKSKKIGDKTHKVDSRIFAAHRLVEGKYPSTKNIQDAYLDLLNNRSAKDWIEKDHRQLLYERLMKKEIPEFKPRPGKIFDDDIEFNLKKKIEFEQDNFLEIDDKVWKRNNFNVWARDELKRIYINPKGKKLNVRMYEDKNRRALVIEGDDFPPASAINDLEQLAIDNKLKILSLITGDKARVIFTP